jgi:hypothetical protein
MGGAPNGPEIWCVCDASGARMQRLRPHFDPGVPVPADSGNGSHPHPAWRAPTATVAPGPTPTGPDGLAEIDPWLSPTPLGHAHGADGIRTRADRRSCPRTIWARPSPGFARVTRRVNLLSASVHEGCPSRSASVGGPSSMREPTSISHPRNGIRARGRPEPTSSPRSSRDNATLSASRAGGYRSQTHR